MISAGGTGGGVYPALAVVGALRTLYPDDLALTFVGARGDMAFDLIRRSSTRFARCGAGRCTAFRAGSRR
jgi:UDP-N-acetylglucosamine:LPS N-acetylglucosamine transferase